MVRPTFGKPCRCCTPCAHRHEQLAPAGRLLGALAPADPWRGRVPRWQLSGRKPADESYFEISVKIAQDDAPLKKLDPPKPKQENPDPEAIPEDLSHTFDLDPELRETIQILGDFVKLSKRLIGQND